MIYCSLVFDSWLFSTKECIIYWRSLRYRAHEMNKRARIYVSLLYNKIQWRVLEIIDLYNNKGYSMCAMGVD
jgi:hypothetical protein